MRIFPVLPILLFCFSFLNYSAFGQSQLWSERSPGEISSITEPDIQAKTARYYEVEFQTILEALTSAEGENLTIELPMPNGKWVEFDLKANTAMQPGLQSKYPLIRAFDGVGRDEFRTKAKIDVSPSGLRAAILHPEGSVFLDPVSVGQNELYMVYLKSEFMSDKQFECLVEEVSEPEGSPKSGSEYASCELNVYRLAMAATGEYTQFHGGTVESAMAAIVTTVNRVNQVYERDVNVSLSLIDDNDLLVFTNPNTDPYSNESAFMMLGQNQATINGVIGSENYDIGHVVGTGAGGVAGLGVTCGPQKARGVTGTNAPVGDPFDIDYVAHEMGHQFGANHTFNNSCQGNRSNATAVEPGSGSTIMGYAGICNPNVQFNSDAHFHGISIFEIGQQVTQNSCQTVVALENTAPVIHDATTDVYLPVLTPFILTAEVTDADEDDVLTYTWDQMNAEISQQPPVPSATDGPSFRSWLPSENPTRYFPRMSSITSPGTPTWEVLPAVSRSMDFRFTVRDNAVGGGCTKYQDVTVHFVSSAGPLAVTQPNLPSALWVAYETETVTWNVAGTNEAPINAQEVDILLSVDGGLTYPYTLAEDVPNHGSATVEVPDVSTNQARVMVVNSDETFFDISNFNFTIEGLESGFVLTTSPGDTSMCVGDELVIEVEVIGSEGFEEPVSLSLLDVPVDFEATLDVDVALPGQTAFVTITNTGGTEPGWYSFEVYGETDEFSYSKEIAFTVNEADLSPPTDLSPPIGQLGMPLNPVLSWATSGSPDAVYRVQFGTNTSTPVVLIDTVVVQPFLELSGLEPNSQYYWRVRAQSICDTSAFGVLHNFTTVGCESFDATDVPVGLPPVQTTTTSTIHIPYSGTVSNVRMWNVHGTHSRISDMAFFLVSPTGTEVELLSNVCPGDQDFDFSFSETGSVSVECPPTEGQVILPAGSLADFSGESIFGEWTLKLVDSQTGAGGQLLGWSLEICTADDQGFDISLGTDSLEACANDSLSVDVQVIGGMSFDLPVELVVWNVPAGINAFLSTESAMPGEVVELTIAVTPEASAGGFYLSVDAYSADFQQVQDSIYIAVDTEAPSPATLVYPTAQSGDVPIFNVFQWESSITPSTTFDFELSDEPEFDVLIHQATGLDTAAYAYGELLPDHTYYWRIRTHNNCGETLSDAVSFTTQTCVLHAYEGGALDLTSEGEATFVSTVEVEATLTPQTMRVSGLQGSFSHMENLTIRLVGPTGTEVNLYDGACEGGDAFFLSFEDGGQIVECPTEMNTTYAPAEPLSVFSGQSQEGVWTLEIEVSGEGGTGELTGWNLEFCDNTIGTTDQSETDFHVYPNPTSGIFTIVQEANASIERVEVRDITGRLLLVHHSGGSPRIQLDLSSYADGVYLIRAVDDRGSFTRRLVKTR